MRFQEPEIRSGSGYTYDFGPLDILTEELNFIFMDWPTSRSYVITDHSISSTELSTLLIPPFLLLLLDRSREIAVTNTYAN